MKKNLIILCTMLVFNYSLQAQEDIYKKLSNYVSVKSLKEKLSILAADSMEGRETGTEGERKAAHYISGQFKKMGLLPGNDASYYMPFSLYRYSLESSSLIINNTPATEFIDYNVSTQSPFTGHENINNLVLFSNKSILDTAFLIGIKDKYILANEPPVRVDLATLLNYMKRKGAKGCFLIKKVLPTKTSANQNDIAYKESPNNFFIVQITDKLINSIIDKSQIQDNKLVYEIKVNINFKSSFHKKVINSQNVMGLLKAKSSNDYVFITSHYDHLGIKNGVIYNGADDDGSGTTSVLEIAQAFCQAKKEGYLPKKNIVFMTVSGEEKGLLGSRYYSENPVYPLENTSVDLNIDMVGRIDPDFKGDSLNYLYIIGDDKLSSQLTPITNEINDTYTKLELNRKFNDLNDPNRFYYRSDHYNFAVKGVPIIFYFSGVHADYHQPTDKIEKINFEQMSKRVKLILLTAWKIANLDKKLVRDIPLK